MKQNKITVSASGILRKTTLRGIISLLLLLLTATSAWATDYVFVYNGNYLGVNAAGTGIENLTTFDPARCVWTCVNGNDEATLGTTSYALRITYNGNTRYLTGSTNNGNAPTLSATAQNVWRLNGNYLAYHWTSGWNNSTNNYSYLYYRSGWKTSTAAGNNRNYGDSYYTGKNGSPDYRATPKTSTPTSARDNTTLPSISCSGLSGSTGLQMERNDNLGGTYILAATTITIGGTTYYKGTNDVYSTTEPSATLNPQYAWSINSGNASITNAGVLTLGNNQTQNVTVRLTITNTNPTINKTVDYNLSATRTDALNETAYSDISITPSSQTLDLGQTVTYSASTTISQLTRTRPQYVTITDQDGHTHYKVGDAYQAAAPTVTETPGAATNFTSFNWSAAEGTAYFTIDPYYSNSSNQVTLTRSAQKTGTRQTFTISVTGQYGSQNKTASATVTIPATQVDLTALHAGEAVNLGMGSSESINGHYTYEPNYDAAGAPYLNFRYTSNNTNVATVDASGNVAAVGPGSTTITITAVKLDGTGGVSCNVTVNVAIDPPTITIDGSGNVTISHPVPGVQIRYTTNGTDPTATTGTVYTASFAAGNEQTIKAIAVANGVASAVASEFYATSGVSGTKVIINDYEDHNWTYYAGVDSEVDGGLYNTNYLGKLYSPNPRNVKITYNGVNGIANSNITVKVSTRTGEGQTSFVYYKTLEEGATAGQYPYQVISNPFSVRPSTGTGNGKVFYGFNGWKIVSGGEYINGYNNGQTLPLDAEITFVNLPYQSVNCTSAEIVFETTWTQANVQRGGGNISNAAFDGGNYEKNFCIINANSGALAPTYPVTIMGVEPDGSATYANTIGGTVTPVDGANNMTKLEYVTWNPGAAINSRGRNFTIGRGVTTSGTARALYGTNSNAAMNQVLKVESGNYASFISYNTNPSSLTKHHVTFGNDYDRAKNDNSKLAIPGEMRLMASSTTRFNTTAGKELAVYVAKSGVFTEGLEHESARASANDFYLWDAGSNNTHVGYRKLVIEGGEFYHIGGGMDKSNTTNIVTLDVRMKGGILHGCIYGGGATYDAAGHKVFVFTGGKVEGWIAPGANGQVTSGTSVLNGATYVYIGGTTQVNSNGNNTSIDASVGGNVFGAGCGNSSTSTRGIINQGTNVVMADEAYVERGVYGGGAYGLCKTDQTANIYMTGGTIGSVYDATYKVYGGIYGGARQNNGGAVNIYMSGGLIKGYTYNGVTGGGLFGGSNDQGIINRSVTMQINGGQVGTDAVPANIHGGGYGNGTVVSQDVDITLGKTGAARDADGVTVWGDVYGGSALGSVNGTSATNDYHTNVTMNAGTINGSLYGGGLGDNSNAANVYGPVSVTVNGGVLRSTDQGGLGAVFGCNNRNGSPQGKVTVDVTGGEMEYIYGGGNAAPYTVPTPNSFDVFHVHMSGGLVRKHVFGGGLGANAVLTGNTEVKVTGGSVVEGNVYGGGHGAEVTGDTHVVIGQ